MTSTVADSRSGGDGGLGHAVHGSSWLRYTPRPGVFDEMMAPDGTVRPHWRDLMAQLDALGPREMALRADRSRRLIRDNGVTYNVYDDPAGHDRPWMLDPVPVLMEEREWIDLERALIQRAHLLNAVLKDLYGPRHLLSEGILPSALVYANPAYLRPLVGAKPRNDRFLHVLAVDLARSPDGRWWVVDTRTEAPSGMGYAIENRIIMNRVLPEVLPALPVHRIRNHLSVIRDALIASTPRTRENPRVVLWTPGPLNETYFEHVYLARYLGLTLVEGEDLTVRDGRVYLKTLEGLHPVDVILRRNESSFCDPLELRGESALGAPGLVEAVHDGSVTLANALGSGLAESPGLMPFLPALCNRLLGEDLYMPSVATWWCGQARERAYTQDRMAELRVRSAFDPTGPVLEGSQLDAAGREALREALDRHPHAWVGQESVALSTAPAWTENGLAPRTLVLRVHVCASRDGYVVIPGGLGRFAGGDDSSNVSMQNGGGSKDVWVLSRHPLGLPPRFRAGEHPITVVRGVRDLPSRVADDLFWLGRYVERCDATTRMLRAMVGRLAEHGAGSVALDVVLRLMWPMGHPPFAPPPGSEAGDHAQTVRAILDANLQPYNPTGLASMVLNVHRIGVRVRDRLSVDNWRAIDALIDTLALWRHTNSVPVAGAPPPSTAATLTLRPEEAAPRLSAVLMPLQVMAGLANENMTRGLGWRFLDTGRRIERALHILETFENVARTSGETRDAALDMALELGDSQMTYRARYLDAPQTVPVLDVMIADESNPRSLAYQFARLGLHMDSLAPDQAFGLRTHEQRLAVRLLGITRTVDLDRMDLMEPADGRRPPGDSATNRSLHDTAAMPPPEDLPALLRLLRSLLTALSESLARQYFAHAVEMRHGSGAPRFHVADDVLGAQP
ncbi:circularly permuted type 2 ATP-grasp protein [Roseospira marina]|nr:circularly permuted type 2 ATP-grasp protein [Roseospira marina]MBB4313841.1 putative circularly permuted ATP-grasp superfamily protein/putative alpha-E superfamily protein [Roseospira marina]MBB5087003.1 putative circularly permuted ATP-grasp superfamily protein/putative alpha-E superfamily protein [Roseospira marina]